MAKLTFLPSGLTLDVSEGQTVFEVGWKHDAGLASACVGKGTCGLCRIVVVEGEENLSPYNETEEKHLGNLYHLTKRRLSCQCVLKGGDVVVEVAPRKRPRRSLRKK